MLDEQITVKTHTQCVWSLTLLFFDYYIFFSQSWKRALHEFVRLNVCLSSDGDESDLHFSFYFLQDTTHFANTLLHNLT